VLSVHVCLSCTFILVCVGEVFAYDVIQVTNNNIQISFAHVFRATPGARAYANLFLACVRRVRSECVSGVRFFVRVSRVRKCVCVCVRGVRVRACVFKEESRTKIARYVRKIQKEH